MNTTTDPNAEAYEAFTAALTDWRAADPATRGAVPQFAAFKKPAGKRSGTDGAVPSIATPSKAPAASADPALQAPKPVGQS